MKKESVPIQSIEDVYINKNQEEALEIIAENAINPNKFRDIFGDKVVDRDLELIKEWVIKFLEESESWSEKEKRIHKLATIFEAIFYQQAESNEWLGPSVFTSVASRYDDIKNGVDCIAEFPKSETSASYLALAVDVTMSKDIEEKFRRIREEIEHGTLTNVKYFISEHTHEKKSLVRIPRVIICAEGDTIKKLSDLQREGKNQELASHPVQCQFLAQVLAQLYRFEQHAVKVNQSEAANIYKEMFELMREIYNKKVEKIDEIGKIGEIRKLDENEKEEYFSKDTIYKYKSIFYAMLEHLDQKGFSPI